MAAIEDQLQLGTKLGMEVAERIYREGAFSHPVAKLKLDSPLLEGIPSGTRVTGVASSASGGMVEGRTSYFSEKGSTDLIVEYAISADQSNYSRCQVGGSPSPNMQGCFIDSGAITVPEFKLTLPYSYDPQNDNFNIRALEGFSKFAEDLMNDCEGSCPYPEFEKFSSFYGLPDYGNNVISAAFDGVNTELLNGNLDFALLGDTARSGMLVESFTLALVCFYNS